MQVSFKIVAIHIAAESLKNTFPHSYIPSVWKSYPFIYSKYENYTHSYIVLSKWCFQNNHLLIMFNYLFGGKRTTWVSFRHQVNNCIPSLYNTLKKSRYFPVLCIWYNIFFSVSCSIIVNTFCDPDIKSPCVDSYRMSMGMTDQ